MSSQTRFHRQANRPRRSSVDVLAQGDRVKMPQQHFTLTREEDRTQAEVMKRDAQYFLDHPTATYYDRPAIPGEAPRVLTAGHLSQYRVKVIRISDEQRARTFYKPEEEDMPDMPQGSARHA